MRLPNLLLAVCILVAALKPDGVCGERAEAAGSAEKEDQKNQQWGFGLSRLLHQDKRDSEDDERPKANKGTPDAANVRVNDDVSSPDYNSKTENTAAASASSAPETSSSAKNLPCTNTSELVQTSFFLTHVLAGTNASLLNAEILLMEELIVETYNALSSDFCDPFHCRLFSAIADHSTKSFFLVPDSEEDAPHVRVRYDVVGFCDDLARLQIQGAYFFHKGMMSKTTECILSTSTSAAVPDAVDWPKDLDNNKKHVAATFSRKTDGVARARRYYRQRLLALKSTRKTVPSLSSNDKESKTTSYYKTNSNSSSCPCSSEYPENRAPTEVEFVQALNEGFIIKAAEQETALGGTLDVVENTTLLHSCSSDAKDRSHMKTTVAIVVSSASSVELLTTAERQALESSFKLTFNELSFWSCDEPHHRRIESVSVTEVVSSGESSDSNENMLLFEVVASCQFCSDLDLLLFTKTTAAASSFLETPYVPLFASRDGTNLFSFDTSDDTATQQCFCPANSEDTVLRSPYSSEFAKAYNHVLSSLVQMQIVKHVTSVSEVVEVESIKCSNDVSQTQTTTTSVVLDLATTKHEVSSWSQADRYAFKVRLGSLAGTNNLSWKKKKNRNDLTLL